MKEKVTMSESDDVDTSGSSTLKSSSATIPRPMNFIFAGLAGMASASILQPLDVIKNYMQVSGEGRKTGRYVSKTSFQVLRTIVQDEGILGIYAGLSAGLLRQATYTSVRIGVYTSLLESSTRTNGCPPEFCAKATIGVVAGAAGAFVGTPADVSLVRMSTDSHLPKSQRRCYKHVFDALIRIVKEEGVLTLWRGFPPTVGRAMVVNACQLSSYTQAKQVILSHPYMEDNIIVHLMASMTSGGVTTVLSMPLDIAKTRIQNMKIVDGKPPYRGTVDVLVKIAKHEGFFSIWKGFTPYYSRLGPNTVLTFFFLEQLTQLYRRLATRGDDIRGNEADSCTMR